MENVQCIITRGLEDIDYGIEKGLVHLSSGPLYRI